MAEHELVKWVESAVADLLGGTQIPVSAIIGRAAGTAVSRVLAKRLANARDVLLEELRRGKPVYLSDVMSEDDAAAFLLRYLRAAQEGAARLNLRLMARVVLGKAHVGEPLYADEFLRYADSLASLTREEVIFLGRLIFWHRRAPVREGPDDNSTPEFRQWRSLRVDVSGPEKAFLDEPTLLATAISASRTGLVVQSSVIGGTIYSPSPALLKLAALVDLEDVLAEDGA